MLCSGVWYHIDSSVFRFPSKCRLLVPRREARKNVPTPAHNVLIAPSIRLPPEIGQSVSRHAHQGFAPGWVLGWRRWWWWYLVCACASHDNRQNKRTSEVTIIYIIIGSCWLLMETAIIAYGLADANNIYPIIIIIINSSHHKHTNRVLSTYFVLLCGTISKEHDR